MLLLVNFVNYPIVLETVLQMRVFPSLFTAKVSISLVRKIPWAGCYGNGLNQALQCKVEWNMNRSISGVHVSIGANTQALYGPQSRGSEQIYGQLSLNNPVWESCAPVAILA